MGVVRLTECCAIRNVAGGQGRPPLRTWVDVVRLRKNLRKSAFRVNRYTLLYLKGVDLMEKTLPLYLGPSVIGSVVCNENEREINLFARTYVALSGIYRAYVRGTGGTVLIGVLAPEKSGFSAKKTITESALARDGLSFSDITYAFAYQSESDGVKSHTKWHRMRGDEADSCKDKTVRELVACSGVLCDSTASPTKLALPLFTGRPFPCPELLCLLTPKNIDGTMYGVLELKNGEIC